jgi:hypothetical protein
MPPVSSNLPSFDHTAKSNRLIVFSEVPGPHERRWDCRWLEKPEAVSKEHKEALNRVIERQEAASEDLPRRRTEFLG